MRNDQGLRTSPEHAGSGTDPSSNPAMAAQEIRAGDSDRDGHFADRGAHRSMGHEGVPVNKFNKCHVRGITMTGLAKLHDARISTIAVPVGRSVWAQGQGLGGLRIARA